MVKNMNIIVAVSKNWGIGKGGDLLFSIPEDMKFFRETTMGKVIVIGRKTLESFPGKKPLPKRENIVLSRNREYNPQGVRMCRTVEELLEVVKDYPGEDVFICGGAEIYKLLLPYCRKAYITRVDAKADADSFMPDISAMPNWQLIEQSEVMESNGYKFTFNTYENNSVLVDKI